MTAQVVRRLYIYTAAFIGLQLVVAGGRGLIGTLLGQLIAPSALGTQVEASQLLSANLALLLVGLPLWAIHWSMAQRGLGRAEEQHALLRRLYGYAVLLVAVVSAMLAARDLLGLLLSALITPVPWEQAGAATGGLLLNLPVMAYHWAIMAADRSTVEQTGGTATLRRWYLVLAQLCGLSLAAFAAIDLCDQLLVQLQANALGSPTSITWSVAGLAAGVAVWVPHRRWGDHLISAPSPLQADERRSLLRQVVVALVITATAIAALGGLTVLIYASLLAAFGEAPWMAVLLEHTRALGVTLVALALWSYHRGLLLAEAQLSAVSERPATAHRLIGYVTAVVGLGALFFGAGGLLGTLLRVVLEPTAMGGGWREPLSLWLALTLVALPVYSRTAWVWERRARAVAEEERALARRIYLYAGLLFGLVAGVSAAIVLVRLLIGALLGVPEADLAIEAGRWLGYVVIGALIAAAYGGLLRRSRTARSTLGRGHIVALVAPEPLRQALVAALAREVGGATVRAVDPAELEQARGALGEADSLIVPLAAVLEGPLRESIRAFGGRRLVLVTPAPGYNLVGAEESEGALARHTARLLRVAWSTTAEANSSPPAPVAVGASPC